MPPDEAEAQAEAEVEALREITDAVIEVAEGLFGIPPEAPRCPR
jgi:hypothetical protein